MATEARLFDSDRQSRKAIQRLGEAGFTPDQIGTGTRLVMVIADGKEADLARAIMQSVDEEGA